ncbi:RSP_7527 family protein [Tropicimonas sp. IMCC6043]|uniref:RSP_7527 family protein n=1 Tax=Tropicimonas sp. IMCC6043 TaxID=2510645 RepID=UPI0013EBB050|nr:hypothetical protein [Tropicimonas sp. IMCC6043]
MDKIDFDRAIHPETLRRIEREAEQMRARMIAESVSAGWKRLTAFVNSSRPASERTA